MSLLLRTTLLELKLSFRNFMAVFFTMVFPAVMLLLFGSIYGNEPSDFYGGYGAVDVLASGYLCMIIAVSGLMNLPMALSQYRERKILKRFMATPIKARDILASQLVVNMIMTFISSTLLIVMGVVVFGLHLQGNPILVLGAMVLIMISLFSMGLFIAGVSKNAKATVAIANVVYFLMLFLSGAALPLEMMPHTVVQVAEYLPLKHGIVLLRGLWLNQPLGGYVKEMLILLCVAIVFSGLALKTFSWTND